ncbi:MAG: hypothetical protein MZW92_74100 [Comamonadaceae bacterium]|nr:hypothetical protein [Comamonadaceae bacterium]
MRHPADHHQPHQRPGGRRGRSSPRGDADMVSMARPLLADADFVRQGGARAAPTRSTPASPATRPASTTSSSGQTCSLPGQSARLPRDRARF